MKKLFVLLIGIVLIFTLSACGSSERPSSIQSPSSNSETPSSIQPPSSNSETPYSNQPPSSPSASADRKEPNQGSQPTSNATTSLNEGTNILVVYFSMPETTDPKNMTKEEDNSVVVIDGKVLGNTQYVAQIIQKNTGADIFRIEPKMPYPTDHKTLVDLASKEQKENARPELAAKVKNLDQYDVIFLGYPNWWGDMPMLLYTFLESHDLSGKTIIPFNTHGGSGFSNTINTIARLQPNATVNKNGFTVSRNDVQDSANDVAAWLRKLNFQKN